MNTEDFYKEKSPYLWNSDSPQKDEGFYGKDDMKRFAEAYHQAKLKLLGIGGVSNSEVALKAFVEEYVEAWEDGIGGDTDLYRKAKSLL